MHKSLIICNLEYPTTLSHESSNLLMQYQSECLEALKSAAKISKPFEKVFMDTLKLFMAIPGKVNFLQMGRYGDFSEQTYRNNFENETFEKPPVNHIRTIG